MKRLLTFCISLLTMLSAAAQGDSVWVEGRVIDANTHRALAACEVQLLRDNDIKALAFCDEEGYFSIGLMPEGGYSLSVTAGGKSLYYAELQLNENAMLNIQLIPDSMFYRTLRPAVVSEIKHGLGNRLIRIPDDPRLWNLNGNPILNDIGPASADLSGGNPFFSRGGLHTWRPRWLDAPFPKAQSSDTTANQQHQVQKQQ